MFDFFFKKKFLVDYLDGFTDIHNHILPGIDDGAKTVEESLDLIKGMGEIGISNFICTPHIMENYYPNNPTSISNSLSLLRNELKKYSMDRVRIDAAAEHMIDSGFEKLIESDKMMPLAQRYILIEMSYLQPSLNFDEALIKIKEKGFFPILAHPERYIFLHQNHKKYATFKEQGILFQLNMLSLSDFYGKEVKKITLRLLEEGLIDFIASDVHNQTQIKAIKNIRLNNKTLERIVPLLRNTVELIV